MLTNQVFEQVTRVLSHVKRRQALQHGVSRRKAGMGTFGGWSLCQWPESDVQERNSNGKVKEGLPLWE